MKFIVTADEIKKIFPDYRGGERIMSGEKIDDRRSSSQNNSLHLYCSMLADELNTAGLDMREVLKQSVDIEWTTESVKKYIWKPIMKTLLGYDSTTQLKKLEGDINRIHDHINRLLTTKYPGFPYIPFPSKEEELKKNKLEYPTDYVGAPTF